MKNNGRRDWSKAARQFRDGWTLEEIATAHGVTRQRISQVLRRDGLAPRAVRTERTRATRTERSEMVARLSRQGLTTSEIAARTGLAVPTVRADLRRAGVDPGRAAARIRSARCQAEWAKWLAYYQSGKTARETAEHFGVSTTIVNVRLRQLGYTPHYGRPA